MSLICEIILYSTDFEYVVVGYFYRYTQDGRNVSDEGTRLKAKIATKTEELAKANSRCSRSQRHQQRLTTLNTELDELKSQQEELKDLPLINNLARKTAHNNKQHAVRLRAARKAEG